jgi:hypothetical protein
MKRIKSLSTWSVGHHILVPLAIVVTVLGSGNASAAYVEHSFIDQRCDSRSEIDNSCLSGYTTGIGTEELTTQQEMDDVYSVESHLTMSCPGESSGRTQISYPVGFPGFTAYNHTECSYGGGHFELHSWGYMYSSFVPHTTVVHSWDLPNAVEDF